MSAHRKPTEKPAARVVFDDRQLTGTERSWVAVASAGTARLYLVGVGPRPLRSIRIGSSREVNAWVSAGELVIAREFLTNFRFDVAGVHAVGRALLRVLCKVDAPKGADYYVLFHDNSDSLGRFCSAALAAVPAALEREPQAPPRRRSQPPENPTDAPKGKQ